MVWSRGMKLKGKTIVGCSGWTIKKCKKLSIGMIAVEFDSPVLKFKNI